MNITLEFMLVIATQLVSSGIFIGGLAMSVHNIDEQLKRLENKQDKHNSIIERLAVVEVKVQDLENYNNSS